MLICKPRVKQEKIRGGKGNSKGREGKAEKGRDGMVAYAQARGGSEEQQRGSKASAAGEARACCCDDPPLQIRGGA